MLIAIIILSVIVVLLLGGLIFACLQVEWERDYSKDLSGQLDEAHSNYAALEEGRDEETESYQQELLTLDEKLAAAKYQLGLAVQELQQCKRDHSKVLEMVLSELG